VRLNQFLASCGLGSRRGCEQLVRDGQVTVNGEVCTSLATQIGPGDSVEFGGRVLKSPSVLTVALHKPAGYVCSRSDEHGRRTVYDLLPVELRRLHYVGRLDRDSEGLLLLTTDGALTQRLSHPSSKVEKEYLVTLEHPYDPGDTALLLAGVETPEGTARFESVTQVAKRQVVVVLTQGLKRQVRHQFAACGNEVLRLVRTRIGGFALGPLAPGKWRRLSPADLRQIG
jgi:23S rRNA pseudouridine2605 synthase